MFVHSAKDQNVRRIHFMLGPECLQSYVQDLRTLSTTRDHRISNTARPRGVYKPSRCLTASSSSHTTLLNISKTSHGLSMTAVQLSAFSLKTSRRPTRCPATLPKTTYVYLLCEVPKPTMTESMLESGIATELWSIKLPGYLTILSSLHALLYNYPKCQALLSHDFGPAPRFSPKTPKLSTNVLDSSLAPSRTKVHFSKYNKRQH
jgi:hypothetical protein